MLNIWKTGPLASELTYDPLLTNYALAYWQQPSAFNVLDIFPDLPVTLPQGQFGVFERGAFYRDEVGPRARGGTYPRTGFGMTKQPYSVAAEGLSTPIDEEDLASTPTPQFLERGKAELLTQQHRIHLMRKWTAGYFKSGIWSTARTGVSSGPGANQFLQFDQSGADPVKYIRKEREDFHLRTGGLGANVMAVGMSLHRVFCDHDEIRDRIPNTMLSVATMQLLAQLFEIDAYVVVGGVWNSAAQGLAENMQFIGDSRSFALFHRTPTPNDPHAPTAGRCITWDGLVPGGGKMVSVNRWRENPYSENLDVRMAVEMYRVAEDLGVFYENAIGASV